MNWIFLIIGVLIGLITGFFFNALYLANSICGTMFTDRHDKEKFIFRLEFDKDPALTPMNRKYMVFRIKETELKSIKTEE